jgi:peptidoglycan/xylan/chitin deacetylase (PgdA/CDA1 family)
MRLFRPSYFAAMLYPEALFRMKTPDRILCLTFDDGPDPGSTPGLLAILRDLDIHAVFFCNGRSAEKYPSLINKIISDGHTVGNHGFSHLNGWLTSCKKYCDDAGRASQFTSDRLFRPPYGRLRLNQYRRLRRTYTIFFWDLMAYDFDKTFGAEKSLELLNRKVRPGSIIVLHDTPASTCSYFLQEFIETSINKGYRFEVEFQVEY